MSHPELPEVLARARQLHQAGRLPEAEVLYRQILEMAPDHPGALHLLGILAWQTGRHAEAMARIQKCITLQPDSATAHYHLGNALRDQGQQEEAIAAYRRAIALQPGSVDAHNNLGLTLRGAGQREASLVVFQQAVKLDPRRADVWNNLAVTLGQHGDFENARQAFHQAISLRPDFAIAHYNLGELWEKCGGLDEAITAYRQALQWKPDFVEAWNNLGLALRGRGRVDEAITSFQRALEIRADYVEAWNNLGLALEDHAQLDEAMECYRRAIQLRPDYAEAHGNLGVALKQKGDLDGAVAALHQALQGPHLRPLVWTNLAATYRERGEIEEAIEAYRESLRLQPQEPAIHSDYIFALFGDPRQDAKAIAGEQRAWCGRFCPPQSRSASLQAFDRSPARRLKIGYVSADFRRHPVGRNLWPLFQCHDHEKFEIICYSVVRYPDQLTAMLRQKSDGWRDAGGLADEALERLIREDRIDILVDLSQHTAGNRLPLFARGPAPVQVSFLGYPETAGLPQIGYRISDPWLEGAGPARAGEAGTPGRNAAPGFDEDSPAEQILLVDSYWCYDRPPVEVPVSPLPASRSGQVTFGCLNNFGKSNEGVWKLWARILRETAGARLALISGPGSHRQRLLQYFESEGVTPERIDLFAPRGFDAYLQLYHSIDIVLDTFPCSGPTGSLDALWMGVPVVSLAGLTGRSRGGWSVLNNAGLPELGAGCEEDYARIATDLAHDLPRLAELRTSLRSRMEQSPIMDARRYARDLEGAYRTMWSQWCRGR